MKIDTEILCSFIDGQLDAQTTQAVQAALETDSGLRREYEDLLKTVQLVRGLPKVSAPTELAEAITANAQREQLLGPAPTTSPTKVRSRLYWGLSVAASLLVGVAVGILGFSTWQGQPDAIDRPVGPYLVTSTKTGESSEMFYAEKAPLPTQPPPALAINGRGVSGKAGEEIVTATKAGSVDGLIRAKGSSSISREDLKTPVPAKSIDLASAVADESSAQAQQALAYDSRHDISLETRESYVGGVKKTDTEANYFQRAGRRILPLEPQIRANNFVNRQMVANQRFEAEPLNVKVLSNDTAKTLQDIRKWAANNSLIDLNKASVKASFPVYTQVVYQGQPGTNIEPAGVNALLLRTTRSQAQQIISELQQQKPLVVSVSVKDEKNSLGLDLAKLKRGELGDVVVARRRLAVAKEEPAPAEPLPATRALQPKCDLEVEKKDAAAYADRTGELSSRQLEVATPPTDKPETDYLFQITNQAQVQSLDDLLTLVVLVEDAQRLKAAQTKPQAESKPTESK